MSPGGNSKDPQARARALANLRRGGVPPAPAGHKRSLKHGAHSLELVKDVSLEVRELMDMIGATTPVRDGQGGLPAHDLLAVERCARILRRYRAVEAWLDLYGELDEKTGEPKPAALQAEKLGVALERSLKVLGLQPESRLAMGVNLVRQSDPLEDWQRRRDQAQEDSA